MMRHIDRHSIIVITIVAAISLFIPAVLVLSSICTVVIALAFDENPRELLGEQLMHIVIGTA